MKAQLLEFWRDEEGATAIEYGLIAGLIAAVIVGVVSVLGDQLDALFNQVADALEGPSGVTNE